MKQKNNFVKFLATVLSILTLVSFMPAAAFAEESGETAAPAAEGVVEAAPAVGTGTEISVPAVDESAASALGDAENSGETQPVETGDKAYTLMAADDGSDSVVIPVPIAEDIQENASGQEETSTQDSQNKGANNPTPASEDDLKIVNVTTDSTKDSESYISVNETIAVKDNSYQVILDGLMEANKDALLNAIKENLNPDVSKAIQFNNELLVDAEKYYSDKDMYDAELCWAAAASDIIWKSGWAEDVTNPLTGEAFASEDEILTYYATYFQDAGYATKDGVKWFFNAISTAQGTADDGAQLTTTKNQKYTNYSSTTTGVETKALTELSKIVSDNIVTSYTPEKSSAADGLNLISVLEKLGTDVVAEVGVSWMNVSDTVSERTISGGHAIAAAGLILDNAKSSLEKYVGILLADSDNSISSSTTGLPSNPTAATTTKEDCQNSYTLYYLSQVTAADGKTYWQVNNYSSGDTVGVIDDITTLQLKSKTDLSSVTDNKGKADALTYADLMVDQIFTSSANVDDIKSTFILDKEDIKLSVDINNQGYGTFQQNDGDASKLSNTLLIFKDGQQINKVNLDYDITKENAAIDGHDTKKISWTLNKYLRSAGDYELQFVLNNKENISEAYYLNNTPQILKITVKDGTSSDIQKGITRDQYAEIKQMKGSALADFNDDEWYDEDEWLYDLIDWDTWTDEDIDSFFEFLDELDTRYDVDDEYWTDEMDEAYVNEVKTYARYLLSKNAPNTINIVTVNTVFDAAAKVISEMTAAIKNAPENGTVNYDTGDVTCISNSLIKQMSARNDLTYVITFTYNNVQYVMTIPAKADFSKALSDSSESLGYFEFASLVPGAEITEA